MFAGVGVTPGKREKYFEQEADWSGLTNQKRDD